MIRLLGLEAIYALNHDQKGDGNMIGQLEATTGLKKRPSYEEIINAQTPYLPAQKRAREDKAFAEKTFAFNEQQAKKDELAAWEIGHEGRKNQNLANNLGYANLATNVLSNTSAFSDLYSSIMDIIPF